MVLQLVRHLVKPLIIISQLHSHLCIIHVYSVITKCHKPFKFLVWRQVASSWGGKQI